MAASRLGSAQSAMKREDCCESMAAKPTPISSATKELSGKVQNSTTVSSMIPAGIRIATIPGNSLRLTDSVSQLLHAVLPSGPSGSRALHLRHRQAFHDLDGNAGEDREVRMVFEHPGRGFVRFGFDDSIGGHLVPDIGDALGADALGLAERRAVVGDGFRVGVPPLIPGLDTGLFPFLALGFV